MVPNINDLIPADQRPLLHYYSKQEQKELLDLVISANEQAGDDEIIDNIKADDLSLEFQNQMIEQRKNAGKGRGGGVAKKKEEAKRITNSSKLFGAWKKGK